MTHVSSIPHIYKKAAIPYLNVHDGAGALAFYKEAFGASEVVRIARKDGKLAHGEIKIGEAIIMLRDEIPEMGFISPQTLGGVPIEILIYVERIEAFVDRAKTAGATIKAPIKEQFHGDLMAIVQDPFGHVWFVASRVRDMTPDELRQRAADWGI